MRQWHAVHTKPRTERSVAKALQERNVEVFLPETTVSIVNRKPRKAPFFPSYLFMRVDLATDNPALWRWTPGLRYLVAYGSRPVPIPDEVINVIGAKLHELEPGDSMPAHPFTPGDVVRIKNGPFRDVLAIFDGPSTPSKRVQVLMGALNNSVKIRIDASALEKAQGPSSLRHVKLPRRTRGRGRHIR